ncbi:MAG: triose-phosphate isomerase [Candidatus Cyclobacteriaceae bacterium M2_1C_046]
MRKKIIAGNWKMNKTKEEAQQLTSEIVNMVKDEVQGNAVVVLAPPFVHLSSVSNLIKGAENIFLGAQNLHQEESGAFTGEVSGPMLKSYNAKYVIIGHSERREHFNEDSELLKDKVVAALKNDLIPIFCCGEPLEVRKNGMYREYVENQIHDSLFHLKDKEFSKVVIAYEPIWAIGTGKTASTEQAQEMHEHIRKFILNRFSSDLAENLSILYGGSMKPDNARELLECPDVDGGLIGGASLKSRDFTDIIKAAKS